MNILIFIDRYASRVMHICLMTLLTIVVLELFFFTYYIHEFGHMVFGFFDGLFHGEVYKIVISNWIPHPHIPFIKLPQQTQIIDGKNSLNFIFGASILNSLIFSAVSLIGYRRTKNPFWFLIAFSIIGFEIFGNFLCGTDNLRNGPREFCQNLPRGEIEVALALIFAIAITILISKTNYYQKLHRLILRRK